MPDPTPSKSLVSSKTLLVNAIVALSALYPPVAHWVSQHAVLVLQVVTYANIGLRFISHKKLSLFGSDS